MEHLASWMPCFLPPAILFQCLFRAGSLPWDWERPSPLAAFGSWVPLWGLGEQAQPHTWWCPFPLSSKSSHSLGEDGLHRDFRKEPASYASGGSQCPWSAGDHKDAGRLRECEFPGPPAPPGWLGACPKAWECTGHADTLCWPRSVRQSRSVTHQASTEQLLWAGAVLRVWSAWISLSHQPTHLPSF